MMETPSPAVVLVSGGMDSTALLHHVVRRLGHAPVYALSFQYGQRHAKELACAAWQAQAAGVAEHHVVDMPFLGPLLKDATALVVDGRPVPDLTTLSDEERRQPPTYVPNRNMMLLAVAAAYAEARGTRAVYYGAHALDEYGYWDCTVEFIGRLNHTLALNRREAVVIHAPFAQQQKADLLRVGLALHVDYAHTWTCYRGGETACGTCPTCIERLQAFQMAGVPDPLPYASAE